MNNTDAVFRHNKIVTGGGALSRQLSSSLITPSSMSGYQDFFRQSSNREEGWLEVKTGGRTDNWEWKYVIFDEGILRYGPAPAAALELFSVVPMDRVISFRTDNHYGTTTIIIAISQPEGKMALYFRAPTLDDLRRWVFTFQKSVALVFSQLLVQSTQGKGTAAQPLLPTHSMALENSHVISRHSSRMEQRYSMVDSAAVSQSFDPRKDISVSASSNYLRSSDQSVLDLTRMTSERLLSAHVSDSSNSRRQSDSTSMGSISPAIPILASSLSSNSLMPGKLAVSFSEHSPNACILNDGLYGLNISGSDSRQLSSDEESGGNGEEDDLKDDMMFDLDEAAAKSAPHKRQTCPPAITKPRPVQQRQPALALTSGFCTKLGPRNTQEDRHVCLPNLSDSLSRSGVFLPVGKSVSFFAVYDGHCGSHASAHLQESFHVAICKHPLFISNIEKAIAETAVAIDKSFLATCRDSRQYSGTTALGAFIIDRRLCVFSIGDCQAFLCRGGRAREMSVCHKPGRPDEVERISRAKGWITEEKELYMGRLHRMDLSDPLVRDKAQQVNWVTIHRVCGELAVSRSIGDPDYKGFTPGEKVDAYFNWPENHDQVFFADLVIPDPEFQSCDITHQDEFLVIASDGLWDVVSGEEAVSRISQCFASGMSPTATAEELCDLAIKLGSSDNVTIVIVTFKEDS